MVRTFLASLTLIVGLLALSSLEGGQAKDAKAAPAAVDADVKDLVAGMNEFAFDLYRQIAAKEKGNIVISPYSISTALAMTYAGARGMTAEEIAKALHLDLPPERLHVACARLIAELQEDKKDRPYQLHVASSLWGQKGLPFVPEFLSLIQRSYGGLLREVEFGRDPDAARHVINQWVEEQTKGRIQQLIRPEHISKGTQLIIANAIYLRSAWMFPFNNTQTNEDDFELADGQKVKVPLMHRLGLYDYFEADGFQMLEVMYQRGDLSCLLILPRKAEGIARIEAKLTTPQLTKWHSLRNTREVEFSLPKYELGNESSLAKHLAALGLKKTFSADADFTGIVASRMEQFGISEMVHKGYIAMDEKGTEAAGAAAVVGGKLIINQKPGSIPAPVAFRVDHPFFFAIRDNRTGILLFIGRIADPRVLKPTSV